jgi:hypothetical protein
MRNDKWITGLVLVLIGAAFLLHNLGYVDIHWYNIIRLWPVFLVIAGVNLVLSSQQAVWAKALKGLVIVVGFGIILFANPGRDRFWKPAYYHFKFDDDKDDGNDNDHDRRGIVKIEGNSNFTEAYTPNVRVAKLNISGGGTTYVLKDTTDQLFNAVTKEFIGRYDFKNTKTDSMAVLDFKMREHNSRHGKEKFEWKSNQDNSATLKLSAKPVWDIHVNTGASKVDFDLTKFKVKNLEINGGAASFDVKLGEPLTETRVEISTGMSEINISVPKNAACKILTASGLSQNTFTGFNKISGNHYETPGFAAAKNKIYIKMNGAMADFNVSRY